MDELYGTWARLWQFRTPAEIAANWWTDCWLAWQQATLRPFIPALEMGDLPPI